MLYDAECIGCHRNAWVDLEVHRIRDTAGLQVNSKYGEVDGVKSCVRIAVEVSDSSISRTENAFVPVELISTESSGSGSGGSTVRRCTRGIVCSDYRVEHRDVGHIFDDSRIERSGTAIVEVGHEYGVVAYIESSGRRGGSSCCGIEASCSGDRSRCKSTCVPLKVITSNIATHSRRVGRSLTEWVGIIAGNLLHDAKGIGRHRNAWVDLEAHRIGDTAGGKVYCEYGEVDGVKPCVRIAVKVSDSSISRTENTFVPVELISTESSGCRSSSSTIRRRTRGVVCSDYGIKNWNVGNIFDDSRIEGSCTAVVKVGHEYGVVTYIESSGRRGGSSCCGIEASRSGDRPRCEGACVPLKVITSDIATRSRRCGSSLTEWVGIIAGNLLSDCEGIGRHRNAWVDLEAHRIGDTAGVKVNRKYSEVDRVKSSVGVAVEVCNGCIGRANHALVPVEFVSTETSGCRSSGSTVWCCTRGVVCCDHGIKYRDVGHIFDDSRVKGSRTTIIEVGDEDRVASYIKTGCGRSSCSCIGSDRSTGWRSTRSKCTCVPVKVITSNIATSGGRIRKNLTQWIGVITTDLLGYSEVIGHHRNAWIDLDSVRLRDTTGHVVYCIERVVDGVKSGVGIAREVCGGGIWCADDAVIPEECIAAGAARGRSRSSTVWRYAGGIIGRHCRIEQWNVCLVFYDGSRLKHGTTVVKIGHHDCVVIGCKVAGRVCCLCRCSVKPGSGRE